MIRRLSKSLLIALKSIFGYPSGSCRFTPTCSEYAAEAFKKKPIPVAFVLTIWRILRCNPFSKGGYDPVTL